MECNVNKNTIGVAYCFPCDSLPLPPMTLVFNSSPVFLELSDLREVLDVLVHEKHLTAYYREDDVNTVTIQFTQLTRLTVLALLQFLTDDQFNDFGGDWTFALGDTGEILGDGMESEVKLGNSDTLDGFN